MSSRVMTELPRWYPARECPQNGLPVMAIFGWESDSDEPCVMRRLGPSLWTNLLGMKVDASPSRWRHMTAAEWAEIAHLFPAAVPESLPTLHDSVHLTDKQYREVMAYCSGVVEVDTAGDGERRGDPASVMAVLLRHLRNMLVDPVGAQSLRHEVRVVRDANGAPINLEYVPISYETEGSDD